MDDVGSFITSKVDGQEGCGLKTWQKVGYNVRLIEMSFNTAELETWTILRGNKRQENDRREKRKSKHDYYVLT